MGLEYTIEELEKGFVINCQVKLTGLCEVMDDFNKMCLALRALPKPIKMILDLSEAQFTLKDLTVISTIISELNIKGKCDVLSLDIYIVDTSYLISAISKIIQAFSHEVCVVTIHRV
jgi:hypothetical protein